MKASGIDELHMDFDLSRVTTDEAIERFNASANGRGFVAIDAPEPWELCAPDAVVRGRYRIVKQFDNSDGRIRGTVSAWCASV